MNAKEKAEEYLKGKEEVITFKKDMREKTKDYFSEYNVSEALEIAIQEAKKEVFDEMEVIFYRWGYAESICFTEWVELKQRHLSTFQKEKQHNSGLKKDRHQ